MTRQTDTTGTNERITGQYGEYLMPIWKDPHVPVRRASGSTLEEFDSNEYLDLFSGISVTNVGHRDDTVVESAKAQLDEFVHGRTHVHPNERGIVAGVGGFHKTVLRIQLPLSIEREQLERAVAGIRSAIDDELEGER